MSLLNKAQIRVFILDFARRNRHHPFTRVSPDVYDVLESKVRDACRGIVEGQPSMGQTIKPI